MVEKNNCQNSQHSLINPQSVESVEPIVDFLVEIEDWESEGHDMLTKTLENNADFRRQKVEEQYYKFLVIESIIKNLSEKQLILLKEYIRRVDENYETAVSMGDMLLYEQMASQNLNDKEK